MIIPEIPFRKEGDFGAFAWLFPDARPKKIPAFPLISALFDASSAIDDLICQQILGENKYHRVQINLDEMIPLDDHTQVKQLRGIATRFIKEDQAWKNSVKWARTNFA